MPSHSPSAVSDRLARRFVANAALAAATLFGSTAHAASCADLIAALDKVWQQDRVAQYEVKGRDQAPGGRPMVVRIGRTLYDGSGGDGYTRTQVEKTDDLLTMLKRDEKSGTAPCEAAGKDSYRGGAMTKLNYRAQIMRNVTMDYTFWIAATNGLPAYHEVNGKFGKGAFAWTYGDAVKEPPTKK